VNALPYEHDRISAHATERLRAMTKTQAHERIDAGTLTWGYLKTLLRCEMGAPAHKSVVNAGMSHEQAVEILARAIDGRPDEEIVGSVWGMESRDRMIATNVLRECAASIGLGR
jgi:hypothetical protein